MDTLAPMSGSEGTMQVKQAWGAAPTKLQSGGTDAAGGAAQQYCMQPPFGLKGDVDVEIGMETEDVHHEMKQMEMLHRHFKPDAKYLKYRRLLVDWMCEVGDELQLHNCTMHVAVVYLDRILSSVTVSKSRMQLVAISCILIGAKYEEAEENVPSSAELNEFAQHEYSTEMIQQMELTVLSRLNWCLTAVTPLHFLGYYLSKGALFVDDLMQGKPLLDKVPRYLQKYAEFFSDLCLQEYSFQVYRPSVLSAAILSASRKALHISPLWRPEMTALTGVTEEEIAPYMQHLWRHYIESFPSAYDSSISNETSPNSVAGF